MGSKMIYALLFIKFKQGLMFYFHMFFHGSNVIYFMANNETFMTHSAQSQNFKVKCMIVIDYASHYLNHIHIYRMVVIYIEKNPCWQIVIIRLPRNFMVFNFSDALPTPWRTQMWIQVKDNGRRRSRDTLPSSQHFEGLRGVLELRDGTTKSWQAYSLTRACTQPTQSG